MESQLPRMIELPEVGYRARCFVCWMLDGCQFVTRDVDDTDNDLPDRNQRSDKGGSECRTGPRLVGCRWRLEKKNGRHQFFAL